MKVVGHQVAWISGCKAKSLTQFSDEQATLQPFHHEAVEILCLAVGNYGERLKCNVQRVKGDPRAQKLRIKSLPWAIKVLKFLRWSV